MNRSKPGLFPVLVWLVLSILEFHSSAVFAQGSLTPPGAPAPTMKSLDQIEPRTPITFLPFNITKAGSYYVTTNLTGVSGQNGISISSGNVTLDLNGFTLFGVAGSFNGIVANGAYTNATVRNGAVTGWGNSGVDTHLAGPFRNLVLENVMTSTNGSHGIITEAGSVIRDCLALNNHGDGFSSLGGQIIHCLARANGGNGITATDCDVRDCRLEYNGARGAVLTRSRVSDSVMEYNSFYGIYCNSVGNEVRRCRIYGNGTFGIYMNGYTMVADSLVSSNSAEGMRLDPGSRGSQITGNTCISNAAGGIVIGDSASYIADNYVVTSSGVIGINVSSAAYTNNVIVRNNVAGNGANNFSVFPGINDVGPIGNAATNTSPWGNISH